LQPNAIFAGKLEGTSGSATGRHFLWLRVEEAMILVKTEAGQRVLKDRSVPLTPRQRSAFILCDGKRTMEEVLQAAMGVTREDIERLIELDLLGPVGGGKLPVARPVAAAAAPVPAPVPAAAPVPAPVVAAQAPAPVAVSPAIPEQAVAADTAPTQAAAAPEPEARSSQQRYKDAYPIATKLSGSLGLRGFRLNLAVEGTSSYEQLLDLFPKIQAAVGAEKAAPLERALKGR
jgi:hypothetical protein